MIDLRKRYKVGDLLAERKTFGGKNVLTIYRVHSFPFVNWKTPSYDMLYAKMIRVKYNNGEWFKDDLSNNIAWSRITAFWDFDFGRGRVYKYKGKI
jgi:hypothetical protein